MGSSFLALDVGARRIGLAVASTEARLPAPLGVIENTNKVIPRLVELVEQQAAQAMIVGLPRGLAGQETQQTETVRQFADQLRQAVPIPIYLQDEALTSHLGETELRQRGRPYNKADIDALAACYILEDWLSEQPKEDP